VSAISGRGACSASRIRDDAIERECSGGAEGYGAGGLVERGACGAASGERGCGGAGECQAVCAACLDVGSGDVVVPAHGEPTACDYGDGGVHIIEQSADAAGCACGGCAGINGLEDGANGIGHGNGGGGVCAGDDGIRSEAEICRADADDLVNLAGDEAAGLIDAGACKVDGLVDGDGESVCVNGVVKAGDDAAVPCGGGAPISGGDGFADSHGLESFRKDEFLQGGLHFGDGGAGVVVGYGEGAEEHGAGFGGLLDLVAFKAGGREGEDNAGVWLVGGGVAPGDGERHGVAVVGFAVDGDGICGVHIFKREGSMRFFLLVLGRKVQTFHQKPCARLRS